MALLNWKYNGTLENTISNSNGGVYLLVFKGAPKRIIYVGTTKCFYRRLNQHKEGYLKGNRTIWRVSNSEDIYELMSCQGQRGKSVRFQYYASLAKKGKLWASTTREKSIITNDLNKNDNFDKNWKSYALFFVNNIEIWTCSMNEHEDRVLALESKIQRTFQKNYLIESHINGFGMCFLGKIEFTGEISNFKYNFQMLPDLDQDSIKLLKNLPDKKTLDFSKNSFKLKKELKEKKRRETKLKHKFSYTSWLIQEDNILFSCSKLDIDIEVVSNEYLQRSTEEVKRRITYLRKYYKFDNP